MPTSTTMIGLFILAVVIFVQMLAILYLVIRKQDQPPSSPYSSSQQGGGSNIQGNHISTLGTLERNINVHLPEIRQDNHDSLFYKQQALDMQHTIDLLMVRLEEKGMLYQELLGEYMTEKKQGRKLRKQLAKMKEEADYLPFLEISG